MKSGDCHNITETFTVLSNAPESIDMTQIVPVENYLTSVYFSSGYKYSNINESKVYLSHLIQIYVPVLQLFLKLV